MLIQSLYRAYTKFTQSSRKADTELSFARCSKSVEFWLAQSLITYLFWRGAARGLLGPLGSRKAYTKRIQSLQNLYKARLMQSLRKAYTKLIQSWYKAHARLTQSEYKAYAKLTQSLCKAYTKLTQNLILIALKKRIWWLSTCLLLAARGLLGPSGLHKACSSLCKACPKLIRSLYKAYTFAYAKLAQSLYNAHTMLIRSLCKAYTKRTQSLHKA